MRTRSLLAAAAAITLSFGLAACGDDDDADDATVDPSEGTIEGDDTGDTEAEGEGSEGAAADLTISNFAFNPQELSVASGDTVTVTNEDGSAHTFTADEAGIDLQLGGSESGEVTVDAEPGDYDFLCTIHPSMQGTLTVS
jgi:plastocyanin